MNLAVASARTVVLTLLLAFVGCGGPKGGGVVRDDCRCEDGCLQACEGGTTHYKTVQRTDDGEPADRDPGEPWEPAEPPSAADELTSDALASALAEADQTDGRAFAGEFATRKGEERLILSSSRVEVRQADGDRLTRKDIALEPDSVKLVRLVDERIEVVGIAADGEERRFVVLRVIGESVAEVFVQPLESDVAVDFVTRGEQWGIRVREGSDEVGRVYEWNPWEGMFRVPKRAPTAPLNGS